MARMHSRKRGKSGSKRPSSKTVPDWVEYGAKEVEDLVSDLGRKGIPASQIGSSLRDQYGIPSVQNITSKTVSQILEENKMLPQFPEDLMNLIRRAVRMRHHMLKNKSDVHNKVKLGHTESKIRRLVRFYWRSGRVPKTWQYDPATAELLVK